jgi:selenide,water dikinase
VLRQLPKQESERVLVGLETPDDAGVYRLDDARALVQTLDFFTPIVDDPYEFGQIAAANSLSDVYAMGGTPLTAMNIVCFPMDGGPAGLDKGVLVDILRGGGDKVAESGAVLLGGHTVNDPVIKFGLSVTGLVAPDAVTAVEGAQAGDVLVLTKALGTGLVTTALKRETARATDVRAAIDSMRALNAAAARAMGRVGVHACTDITGFGLLGHLGEMAEAGGVGARLVAAALPLLPGALDYAAAGVDTGGGRANAAHLGDRVRFADGIPDALRVLCFDPQTSGGLLMAVPPARVAALLAELEREAVAVRAVIGEITAGPAGGVEVA